MTVQMERPVAPPVTEEAAPGLDPFDLDITIVEGSPNADHLIRLTDDGCGQTCESACNSSCP
ncbi:FxLD family lanthipeptide [Streptomyces shenzhenensis]|uniref:FxLD family lanthipeptide n=1 Tax=Streptomyces shenzhenensis TaxID=943815 RepID=UPI0015F04780|nr:FxLD family lanthipeptide [Streptomyces shenzhenensis]